MGHEDAKETALNLARDVGAAEAARRLGIHVNTVARWARKAGIVRRWKPIRRGISRVAVEVEPQLRDAVIDECEHRGIPLAQAVAEALQEWIEWSVEQEPRR